MAEVEEVLFGTFTSSEVQDLFLLDTSHLEFGWLKKKQKERNQAKNCLNNAIIKTPDKLMTPRQYNFGGSSPNIPLNPPTTPVSEVNSRGTSPHPSLPSRLNANAPPFIPSSDPSTTNLSSVRAALEERLATPTNERLATPTNERLATPTSEDLATPTYEGSKITEESATPVQTVGIPTPALPSVTGGVASGEETRTDPSPCVNPQSPPSQLSSSSSPLSSPAPTNTPASAKPKTWASIVGKSGSGSQISTTPTTPISSSSEAVEKPVEAISDISSSGPKPSVHQKSLGDQLKRLTVSHHPISLQPRGLINQGNWCYMHAPLQALISVPEVCHILRQLNPDPPLSLTPSNTPLTDTLTQFIQEFSEYQTPPPPPATSPGQSPSVKNKRKRPAVTDVICGAPFRPDSVYDVLHKIETSLSTKGRQEDAEEFLGYVLGGLHEEMVDAQNAVGRRREVKDKEASGGDGGGEGGGGGGGKEEGEWEQVGPKNKSTVTRQMMFSDSMVSEVFGGELRCVLQRHGAKESATVEPFFSLQLDIQSEKVWSIQDALVYLAMKEAVQLSSGTEEVDAHRRQSLAKLPMILVLHLKRFIFDKTGGSQKLMKHITFSIDLEVGRDLLAPSIRSKVTNQQRAYKLWAVVYHHGKSSVGGHYTSDVRHTASEGWLRYDDSIVKPISEESILKQSPSSTRLAYLLFYRRVDCIRTS